MACWAFGEFVLDLNTHELARAGTPVSLSPKAFQLLGILVESHPKALSRVELQDRLWPRTFVVEKNLTNLVSEIREALGDDPVHPRFIRTVHRFGYAFREPPAKESTRTAAPDARRHNLPVALTNFIGRDQEVAELVRLAASTRLLTLTGAGGCGKTRLALELARNVLDRFSGGVWIVDLAALSDPSLVTQTVASVLSVREGPSRPLRETLEDYLRHRQILLILDNCEHLITACAQLAEALLRGAARLSILATSRERLGITGETVWRVPSLSLPDLLQPGSSETLLQSDAVRLFVERAAAVDPSFNVTEANASVVAQVCVRLDGIPLALELAAARMPALSLEQINSRLHDCFRLLTGGSRTGVARQRTLEATVDWSYCLLSDSERRLLRRLSVFGGGWTMEAAEQVTSGNGEREDVLDVLSRLVETSLVNVDGDIDGSRRYRVLETVRQYGWKRLLQAGEAERMRDRHLDFFHELVRRAEPELTGTAQVLWLNRLHREYDNLRGALQWGLTAPERGERSLEFATALSWFWMKQGYLREGQAYLERALANSNAPIAVRAKALMGLGSLIFFQGDLTRARLVLEESVTLGRAAGDLSVVGFSLGMSALAATELGNLAESARIATEGQAAARASASPWMQGPSLACLAYHAMHDGDFDRAGRLHEEALELTRRQGEKWGMGVSLSDLAVLRVVQQRYPEARALCAEGLLLYKEFGDRLGIAWCLGILSGAEAADGHPLRAARLRGAMEGLLESISAPVQASFKRWIGDRNLDDIKNSLGDSVFRAALADGRAMSLSRAIQFGLEDEAAGCRVLARVRTSVSAERNFLVVLPFANLSPDRDTDYFADGLTDELIGDLSKLRDLRVICRTSAMACKGTAKDARTIAGELGVQYVVEGSVRRAGDRLRVTAQLVNASTNACLWSDRYDGVLDDVFAIQERLARTIAEALQVRLTPEEDARLAARSIRNVHAHECYLRARQQIWRWRKDAIDHAIQILSNGLRIVGENALLHATMGLAHVLSREAGIDLSEAPVAAAEACARKATALDPTLPEVRLLRGGIHFARARIADAARDFQAALDADPNNADALSILGNCYLISGRVERARPLIERFTAVDPLNPLSRALRGYADMLEGRTETAVVAYREMFEMDPSSPMARLFYGMNVVRAGRLDEAAAVLGGFDADVRESLGARLGACLRAAVDGTIPEDLSKLADEFTRVGTISDMFARFLAWCYAQLGDAEHAVYWLRVAADRGFINYPFLAQHDGLLAKIRGDLAFQAFLPTMRERWERFDA
jgi:predicted ATPase/TolB-like protein/DNA-binding winged helix-turn-helix (wHTH) protein